MLSDSVKERLTESKRDQLREREANTWKERITERARGGEREEGREAD